MRTFGEFQVRGIALVETRLLIRPSGVKGRSRVVAFGGCVGVLDLALRAGARAYFGPRPSG